MKNLLPLDLAIIVTVALLFCAAVQGCIRSQERNNPCDPAVATPTVAP